MKRIFLVTILIFSFILCSCTAKSKGSTPPSAQPSVTPTAQPSVNPTASPSVLPSPPAELPLVDFSTQTPLSVYTQAADYLRTVHYYRAEGEGRVKNTLSTQDMLTLFEKDGNRHLNSSFSSGFVNQATEIVSQAGEITVRQGKYDKKTGTASYGAPKSFTPQSFQEQWGGDSTFPFCYLVTGQTLLSSVGEERENGYTATLSLNAQTATAEYVKRMKKSGDISAPTFSSVSLTFTVDAYGRFTSFTIKEEYTVKIIFRVKCEMQLTHVFYYEK
ncbi:MAG: PT domain-containing protein [Clostridia bacterium]|nr:PT domain-containing protein [Clostridia bacterium]